ncbi:hypothetical protein F5I97DRAFT_1512756 [Phlebopus sp. FC_14]|nr:hypothetical protein F5I97DRAFT_1512756 [Phlebopus sp. FC_14]
MGGDHKCPVCQATFTRPQHVARHMRSHTGDRPYKCQYCGDQFARSDLLSRHVNKCHGNEKPPPNSSNGRRKGSASASRATTSKQACDQCVQSSLPCDGSNPCSKCVSRKCRCTYVKFHRQTAPSGPGHHNPRPVPASSYAGNVRLPSHPEEFILAPPPSSVPSMVGPPGPDALFHAPYGFNPSYPSELSHPPPVSMASDVDLAAKYRVQGLLPDLYTNAQQQQQPPLQHWYAGGSGGWNDNGPGASNTFGHGGYPPMDDKEYPGGLNRQFSSSSDTFPTEFYNQHSGVIGSAYGPARPRRVSIDVEFSDSSSATSHSVPSSASSSNVQLPLAAGAGAEMYHDGHHGEDMIGPDSMPHSSTFHPSSDSGEQQGQQQRPGEGGFSSAFGLMSIDDPNVLAGLSADGAPFFSQLSMNLPPHSPNVTPMPPRVSQHHAASQQHHMQRDRGMSLSALPPPGLNREMDTRDLKEFWKTYMRTPLSGPSLDVPPASIPQSQTPHSPTGMRRRVRVSSLPNVTPTVERAYPGMHGIGNGHVIGHGEDHSIVRNATAHGNPEDLRSYEAAVNARSAALKLNLVPKQPRGTGTSPPITATSNSTNAGTSTTDRGGTVISRPSSSSSGSSLAHAFGVPPSSAVPLSISASTTPSLSNIVKPPPMQGASISLPMPPLSAHSGSSTFGGGSGAFGSSASRESSVASDGTSGPGGGSSASDGEVFRPSFKRLPSQTLGPTSSKRALVERGSGGGKRVAKDGASRKEDVIELKNEVNGGSKGDDTGPSTDRAGADAENARPIAALPERARQANETGVRDG